MNRFTAWMKKAKTGFSKTKDQVLNLYQLVLQFVADSVHAYPWSTIPYFLLLLAAHYSLYRPFEAIRPILFFLITQLVDAGLRIGPHLPLLPFIWLLFVESGIAGWIYQQCWLQAKLGDDPLKKLL